MNTFSEQVEGVTGNVLRVFDTTVRAGVLNELLGIEGTRAFTVRSRSISAKLKPDECDLTFEASSGDPMLHLRFTGRAVNARKNTETIILELTSNFPDLIRPYINSSPFDALLVADADDRIFERKGRVGAKGLRLDPRVTQVPVQPTGSDPQAAADQVIPLEGHEYLVFSRQITLDLGSLGSGSGSGSDSGASSRCAVTDSKRTLRAVGLVKLETIREESQRIPQGPLIVLMLIVALLASSLPFLKLFTLEPQEPFRRRDLAFLAAAALMLAAVAVLGVLIVSSHLSLARQEEEQMRLLAKSIRAKFATERKLAYEQIEKLERYEAQPGSRQRLVQALRKLPGVLKRYPHFDRALFVDGSGEPIAYLTVHGQLPPAANVREREYFQAIAEKRQEIAHGDFAPEAVTPIDSWSTGERITLFAKASEDDKQRYLLAGLLARTLSLERAVLAPGYRLVVVDAGGNVLYHSDTWRAGYENLLEECDRPPALVRALDIKSDPRKDLLYTSYSGTPHRVLVAPLVKDSLVGKGGFTDWKLAILHDRQEIRALHLHVPVYSLAVFLVWPLAIFVGILVLLPQERLEGWWFGFPEDAPRGQRQILWSVLAFGALPALILYGSFFAIKAGCLAEGVKRWELEVEQRRENSLEEQYKDIAGKEIAIADRKKNPKKDRLDEHDWSLSSSRAWLVPSPGAGWLGRAALLVLLLLALGLVLLLPLKLFRRAVRKLGLLPQQPQMPQFPVLELKLCPRESVWVTTWRQAAKVTVSVEDLARSGGNTSNLEEIYGGELDTLVVPDFDYGSDHELRRRILQILLRRWRGMLRLVSEVAPQELGFPEAEVSENDEVLLLGHRFRVSHPEQVSDEIQTLSRNDPERIWKGLTRDEQWALQQIVNRMAIRPGMNRPVASLQSYGLVCFEPSLRICETTFEEFVREQASQAPKLSAVPAQVGWQNLRTVVLLLVGLLSGFLFFLQEGVFLTVSSAVTSIGGLLAAVYQLGDQLRRRGSEPAKEGAAAKGEKNP